MKKNAAILRRFKKKLKSTPAALLAQTAFMIIDDECDQASVNSARLQASISATNKVIREIVALLPKVAYVGYTATPFANILIDPNEPQDRSEEHTSELQSLMRISYAVFCLKKKIKTI